MIPPLGTRVTPDWLDTELPHRPEHTDETLIDNAGSLPLKGQTIMRPNALFAEKPASVDKNETSLDEPSAFDQLLGPLLMFLTPIVTLSSAILLLRHRLRKNRLAKLDKSLVTDKTESPAATQKPPQAPPPFIPGKAGTIMDILNQPLANGRPISEPFKLPETAFRTGLKGFIPKDYEKLEWVLRCALPEAKTVTTVSTEDGDVKTSVFKGGSTFHPRSIVLYEFPTPEFLTRDIDGSIITAGEGFLKANAFLVITQVFDMEGNPVEKLATLNTNSPHYVEREIRFHYDKDGNFTAVIVRDREFSLTRNSIIGYTGRLLAQFTPENMPAPDEEKFERTRIEAAEKDMRRHIDGLQQIIALDAGGVDGRIYGEKGIGHGPNFPRFWDAIEEAVREWFDRPPQFKDVELGNGVGTLKIDTDPIKNPSSSVGRQMVWFHPKEGGWMIPVEWVKFRALDIHLEGLLSSLRDSLARYASQTGDQKEQATAVILENAKLAMHTLGSAIEPPISIPDWLTEELSIAARDESKEKEARDPRVILESTQEKAGLLRTLGDIFEEIGGLEQMKEAYSLLVKYTLANGSSEGKRGRLAELFATSYNRTQQFLLLQELALDRNDITLDDIRAVLEDPRARTDITLRKTFAGILGTGKADLREKIRIGIPKLAPDYSFRFHQQRRERVTNPSALTTRMEDWNSKIEKFESRIREARKARRGKRK